MGKMRHGGKILVDQLALQGATRVFSVPGESFLAALDGLHDSGIANIVCRHEGGAAMMAEAHGKLTGRPGIAFVTRGPGATNASAGVHVARQDSTPMILFVGQIARADRDREAFQEVDYRAMFGGLAKWVTEIDQVERIPEYISRAYHVALSGRPGPVVLALPEDMLSSSADVPDIAARAPVPATVSAGRGRRRDPRAGACRTPAGDRRRQRLERAGRRRPCPLCGRLGPAGRGAVPPAGPYGQPPSELCGRPWRRDEPGFGQAPARGGCDPGAGRADRRQPDPGV